MTATSVNLPKARAIRYSFHEDVSFDEIEETLLLSAFAVESLHGEVTARLGAGYLIDRAERTCLLCCSTPAGHDLNVVFTGYLRREIGPSAFTIQRLNAPESVTA